MSARILVVDDEANIRALIEEILSEEGYEVTTAADAKEARLARKEREFDLILLDIWMPDTDGISLLKEWSENGAGGTVVMMSGHGTVDTAVEATRLGAVDFIEKPVSLAKLLRTVEKGLALRRGKEQRRGAGAQIVVPAGKSQPMRALREQVARVAQHEAHTLFTGEPGSGRELFARYLAGQSGQARGPFVVVMGGDLSDEQAQRELLGDGQPARSSAPTAASFKARRRVARGQRLLLGARAGQLSRRKPRAARGTHTLQRRRIRAQRQRATELLSPCVVVIRVPPLRDYPEDVPELLRYHVDCWSMQRTCRSVGSASPRRIGYATIRGRVTCASCATWSNAC
jgi:DNA-binding NtrC family response regulator